MEIYLIRHTTPDVPTNTHYGQSDVLLKKSFEKEFIELKKYLPEQFDVVYSSPLKRCKLLAEKLNSLNINFESRLMELDFGKWELKSYNDISQEEQNLWMNDFVNYRIPEGESYMDLYARVKSFWDEIIQLNFSKVAIVTHGGVIRAIFSIILEMSLHASFRLPAGYGSVTAVEHFKESNYCKIKYIDRN